MPPAPISRQLTPPTPPVILPPRPLTPAVVVPPRSSTPPVILSPVGRSVDTVPSTLDQDFAYLREVCTVEDKGHPDDVGDAFRSDVLWVRSHAAASGGLEALGTLEIYIGEMTQQARVSRISAIESASALVQSQTEVGGLRQRLLDARVDRSVVDAVDSSDAVRALQSELAASQLEQAERLAKVGHLEQKSRDEIAEHRRLSESLKFIEGQQPAARQVEDALRARCDEISLQEGMDRERAQAASDVNNRHRATIRDQRRENAEISSATVSAAIALG